MDQSIDLQPESNMCQGNWQQIPDLDPPAKPQAVSYNNNDD